MNAPRPHDPALPPEALSTLSDAPGAEQACSRARIHLVLGPVGAGKSTYAVALAKTHGAARFTLDEWMTELFAPDRPDGDRVPWYRARAERCVTRILATAREVVNAGGCAVLEIGLLDRASRARFHARVREAGHELEVYVLEAPRDVRRARVEARNRERGETFAMVVPLAIFELASDMWEPVGPDELEGATVHHVSTDR